MLNFFVPFVPYLTVLVLIIIVFIVTKDLMNMTKEMKLISKRYMDERLRDATVIRYLRILHYAEEQKIKGKKYKYPSSLRTMYKDIDTGFNSTFCIYCSIYSKSPNHCEDCPLGKTPLYCCKGLWVDMTYSKTWEELIKGCNKLVNYIKRHGA